MHMRVGLVRYMYGKDSGVSRDAVGMAKLCIEMWLLEVSDGLF